MFTNYKERHTAPNDSLSTYARHELDDAPPKEERSLASQNAFRANVKNAILTGNTDNLTKEEKDDVNFRLKNPTYYPTIFSGLEPLTRGGRGTKRRGRGTKRRGPKRRGTKRRGPKRRGAKRR